MTQPCKLHYKDKLKENKDKSHRNDVTTALLQLILEKERFKLSSRPLDFISQICQKKNNSEEYSTICIPEFSCLQFFL